MSDDLATRLSEWLMDAEPGLRSADHAANAQAVDALSTVLGYRLAPVFLQGGKAALDAVLTQAMGRVIDCAMSASDVVIKERQDEAGGAQTH